MIKKPEISINTQILISLNTNAEKNSENAQARFIRQQRILTVEFKLLFLILK